MAGSFPFYPKKASLIHVSYPNAYALETIYLSIFVIIIRLKIKNMFTPPPRMIYRKFYKHP